MKNKIFLIIFVNTILISHTFSNEINVNGICEASCNYSCGPMEENCSRKGLVCCTDNLRSNLSIDECPKVYGCMTARECENLTDDASFLYWPYYAAVL